MSDPTLTAMQAYAAGEEDRKLARQIVEGLLRFDRIDDAQAIKVIAFLIAEMHTHRTAKGELPKL